MNKSVIVKKENINLRDIRDTLNLTQNEFCHLLDMSRATLARYEANQQEPRLTFAQFKVLLSLLKASGHKLEDLI